MTQGLSDDEWESNSWSEPDVDDDRGAGYGQVFDGAFILPPNDDEYDDDPTAPSLAVILFSAMAGMAGAIFGLYVAYGVLDLGIELSAGIATLSMLLCLGISGAAVSSVTGTRAAPINMAFSCGLILVSVLFLVCCALCGALAASFLIDI